MSRQYLGDILADPFLSNITSFIGTTEVALFPPPQFFPIPIGAMRVGKIFKISAGGILSTSLGGNITITPRFGTTIAGISMGASVAQAAQTTATPGPWTLEFHCAVLSVGLAGLNSTVIGTGVFNCQLLGTVGTTNCVTFGGGTATVDATIAQGIWLGFTLSAVGSMQPQWSAFQSLN